MPIQLTTPIVHPTTQESLNIAAVRRVMLDPLGEHPSASWEMWFGTIGAEGLELKLRDEVRYSVQDIPEERGMGFNPETGNHEEGVVRPADTSFSDLVAMAVHVVDGSETVGDLITAYDLIGEKAIYPYVQILDSRFAGVIL